MMAKSTRSTPADELRDAAMQLEACPNDATIKDTGTARWSVFVTPTRK